jgi:hypothetical protein
MWDSPNKNHWVPDEVSASVVREIFHLCVCGNGPSQIANILNERQVIAPSAYSKKHGIQRTGIHEALWCPRTVAMCYRYTRTKTGYKKAGGSLYDRTPYSAILPMKLK